MKNVVKRWSLILVICLAGCNTQPYLKAGSIANGNQSTKVDYVATDAKQRLVNYIDVGDGFISDTRSIKPKKLICAEPSPDVASSIQYAIDAALKYNNGKTDASAGVSITFAESLLQLGKRIATIQLLRDELADLCRTYANGAITGATYSIRLSRLDKKMVTLLSSEAAAGAISETSKALVGNATLSKTGNPEEVSRAKAAAEQAAKDVKTASDDFANNTDDKKKADLQATLKAKVDALDVANRNLALAALESSNKTLVASAQLQTGATSGVSFTVSPETIKDIQDNFLRVDDASTIIDTCLTNITETSNRNQGLIAEYEAKLKADVNNLEKRDDLASNPDVVSKLKKIKDKLGLLSRLKKKIEDKQERQVESEHRVLLSGVTALHIELASDADKQQMLSELQATLDAQSTKNSLGDYCTEKALPRMYQLMETQASAKKEIELAKYTAKEKEKIQDVKLAEQETSKAEAETKSSDIQVTLKCFDTLSPKNKADTALKEFCTNKLAPPKAPKPVQCANETDKKIQFQCLAMAKKYPDEAVTNFCNEALKLSNECASGSGKK